MWAPQSFGRSETLGSMWLRKMWPTFCQKLKMNSIWIVGSMPWNLYIRNTIAQPDRMESRGKQKRNASEKKKAIGYHFSGPNVIHGKDVRSWSVLFRIRMNVCLAACSPEWQAHTTRSNIRLRPACMAFLFRNLFTVQSKRWSMHGKTTNDTYRIFSCDRADCAEHFIENRATRRSANTKSKLSIDTYSSYMHTRYIHHPQST